MGNTLFSEKELLKEFKKQQPLKDTLLTALSQENAQFISHRTKGIIPSLGKWNLTALTSGDSVNTSLLIELTEKLFQTLYGHAAFWKEAEKKIPHFSHRMISSFLEKKDAVLLSDLFPQDLELQPMFYKMLQGSGFYDLAKQKGYPPLKDFCSLITDNSTLTNFPTANILIIKTLFSDEIVQEILLLEKVKWEKDHKAHSLTKEELKQVCSQHRLALQGKRFEQIEPLLQFSHKKDNQKKLIYKDQKTQIPLELAVPS